jgi:hypothetical protein
MANRGDAEKSEIQVKIKKGEGKEFEQLGSLCELCVSLVNTSL